MWFKGGLDGGEWRGGFYATDYAENRACELIKKCWPLETTSHKKIPALQLSPSNSHISPLLGSTADQG